MLGLNQFMAEDLHRAQLKEIERQSDALELIRQARPPRPALGMRVFCRILQAMGSLLVGLGRRLQESQTSFPARLNETLVRNLEKSL